MKIASKFLLVFLISLFLFGCNFAFAALLASAETGLQSGLDKAAIEGGVKMEAEPIGNNSLTVFLGEFTNYFFPAISMVYLLLVVYGGLLWLTSFGEAQAITKAKNVLVYSTVGFALAVLSFYVVEEIFNIFSRL